MDNETEKVYKTLITEYIKFASNPPRYFANILDNSLGIMVKNYPNYDIEVLTKKLTFLRLFIQNWNGMSEKNVGKILSYGAKEKNDLLLNIYAYIALFSDLLESEILIGTVVNKNTGITNPIIVGLQEYFISALTVIDSFLLKYDPSFDTQEIGNILSEIYDSETKNRKSSYNNNEMYS